MISGRVYFYTSTIIKWLPIMMDDQVKNVIISSFNCLVKNDIIKIYAFVIMPNHLHFLGKICLNNEANKVQLRFMKFTAQQIKFYLRDNDPDNLRLLHVDKADRKYQIWQRNAMAIEVTNQKSLEQIISYIHTNPIQKKWHLVESPVEYYYSSMAFYEKEENNFPFLTHVLKDSI